MWRNFLPISSYIFTISFNVTYKIGKHLHLVAKHNEVLVKKIRVSQYFLTALSLNSYTVNSYSSSQNALRLIHEIE